MLHILHLRHREDRMITLKQELLSQGIKDYAIIYGLTNDSPKKNISRGHKMIVQAAKDGGLPFVIIAEDDVKFTHPNSYKRFIETMPLDCDMYLGCIYGGNPIKEDNTTDFFTGLILYAVMERFYDTFLSVDENSHIDAGLKGLGKFVVANPFVVTQHPGYSDQRRRVCLNDDVKLRGRDLYRG